MRRRFHPEARAEFVADVDWYDSKDPFTGQRFQDAAHQALDDAAASPDSWPRWPGWNREPVARSRGVAGFPYRIVYTAVDGQLMVIAVAHEKRQPGYWRNRITP